MTIASRTCLQNTLCAVAVSLCSLAPLSAQTPSAPPPQRFSVSVGGTALPMNARSGGTVAAATAVGRIKLLQHGRFSGSVAATAIMPLQVTSIAADCVPDVPCPSYQSPEALYGAAAEVGISTRTRTFGATAGVGFLSAQNLSDVTGTNSPTFELGAEYVILPARRVSPVISVRVLRLTRAVAGLEAVLLPTLGIVF